MTDPEIRDTAAAAPRSTRLWQAETARHVVLERVTETVRLARENGLRPRLVIFDYSDNPVAGPLRSMAQELGMLVGVEAIERSLPSANLRDRFRLLEKSKGVHGIFFPASLTASHRACLEAHPSLASLELDRPKEGFSPLIVSFLQLAAVAGWDPQGRVASVAYSSSTRSCATALAKELQGLGMRVLCWEHPAELGGSVSQSSLLWLCHGKPLSMARLHLAADAVVVDSGRAIDLPSSFTEAQARLLPHRQQGFCPSDSGLGSLVNLNRIHKLLSRALGPRRQRSTASSIAQRGNFRA